VTKIKTNIFSPLLTINTIMSFYDTMTIPITTLLITTLLNATLNIYFLFSVLSKVITSNYIISNVTCIKCYKNCHIKKSLYKLSHLSSVVVSFLHLKNLLSLV
jgi:hypothetical protein